MTIAFPRRPSRPRRISNTVLRPDGQLSTSKPMELNIIRRPFKFPLRKRPTTLQLLFQALPIRTQFSIGPILATDLEAIEEESVGDVAAELVDLFGKRLHFEDPAVRKGECGAKLVVVWVIELVVAVAAVDYGVDEIVTAVWCIAGSFLVIFGEFDGETEVVDTVFVIPGERRRCISEKAVLSCMWITHSTDLELCLQKSSAFFTAVSLCITQKSPLTPWQLLSSFLSPAGGSVGFVGAAERMLCKYADGYAESGAKVSILTTVSSFG
jgi:hypothetical protein